MRQSCARRSRTGADGGGDAARFGRTTWGGKKEGRRYGHMGEEAVGPWTMMNDVTTVAVL